MSDKLAAFQVDQPPMPKEVISQSVFQLLARKRAIENEIAEVDSRLHAISKVLNGDEPAPTLKRKLASPNSRAGPTAKRRRETNRWFATGEAVSLMKRHVRKPMTPSQIVKVLARAKGLDRGLSGVQAKRFHATAYMAVTNALKGGAATRLRDGRVRVA